MIMQSKSGVAVVVGNMQASKYLILYPSKDTYNYVGYDDDYYCQLFAHYKC